MIIFNIFSGDSNSLKISLSMDINFNNLDEAVYENSNKYKLNRKKNSPKSVIS